MLQSAASVTGPDLAPPLAGPGSRVGPASVELADHRLEIRLLGPLEVSHRGRPVRAGGLKKRALLARLALDANRTVSVDRLVDALWGDHVPATAVKMVQIYVSQLRKVLPVGVLHTRAPGYALEIAPEAVDLSRFARLRAEARAALAGRDAATASDRLRAALALWHGPALAEFSEPFAIVEAAHLEELRLAALEERIDADLALGRHADVVGELRTLVAHHPHRQRLHAQLMLALYRAGRHAEALDVYQRLHRTVREDLGIEPSAALSDLQYRILHQDPELDLAPRGGADRPAPVAELRPQRAGVLPAPRTREPIGREHDLGRLQQAFDAAAAGHGSMALLIGPAGIGKTHLAGELAERARRREATVLTGRCIDLVGAAVPYLPLVEALRPLRSSPALAGLDQLSRLFPGAGGPPPAAERSAGDARLHLFEEVVALLDRLGAAAPVVLVVEDVHWADGSTLDLLAYLARAVHGRRVLLVASLRSDTTDPDDGVHRLVAGLRRAGVADAVELSPLADGEMRELLARAGDAPLRPEIVDHVCVRAEGNPFLAGELLAAALRGEEHLPKLLRDVLLADFSRLDARSRSVVRVAAAAGRAVPHGLLSAASHLSEPELVDALRQAVEHNVLIPDPARRTYRFRHALIAEAAYATLLPFEREEVHERLALALSHHPYLSASGAGAGELAEHWIAAGRPVEGLAASLRAARDAQAVSGLAEALRHVEHVLDLWEDVPHAEEVAGLALPALLAWAAELAGAVERRDSPIDARALAGVLGAGDATDARTVAVRMGLTTEAAAAMLDQLVRDGLLEHAGDGVFGPRRLGVDEARELYPLVVVLESLAIRQSPPLTPDRLRALADANERMRAALHAPSAAIVADDDFHRELTAGCGNEPLLAALRPVRRALLRYEQVYMLEPARIARSVAQHEGIIEALAAGDHPSAAQRLRHNLTGGLPDLKAALER